ncbi:MAG: hypothetical protein MAG551_01721 [Candidatus Scalindua arabica]|uniref:Uncharacterized protein n=1 Tax=Candidatus Scalindua arabica TaxID=1127984 RepID=A0A942A192_9BACT|nr:hypothetical protein [Candidatus Scalindua arabica]
MPVINGCRIAADIKSTNKEKWLKIYGIVINKKKQKESWK